MLRRSKVHSETSRLSETFSRGGDHATTVALQTLSWPPWSRPPSRTLRPGKSPSTAVAATSRISRSSRIHNKVPTGDYRLKSEPNGSTLPARVFSDGGRNYLAAVLKGVGGETRSTYTLEPESSSAGGSSGVAFREAGRDVDVFTGGKLLTVYHTDEPTKPYYYPLIGPNNLPLTRAFPIKKDVPGEDHDHFHQRVAVVHARQSERSGFLGVRPAQRHRNLISGSSGEWFVP